MCQPPRPQQQRQQHLSTGQVAQQLGVPIWKVRRAVDDLLPNAPRVGQNRIITADELQQLAYVLGSHSKNS